MSFHWSDLTAEILRPYDHAFDPTKAGNVLPPTEELPYQNVRAAIVKLGQKLPAAGDLTGPFDALTGFLYKSDNFLAPALKSAKKVQSEESAKQSTKQEQDENSPSMRAQVEKILQNWVSIMQQVEDLQLDLRQSATIFEDQTNGQAKVIKLGHKVIRLRKDGLDTRNEMLSGLVRFRKVLEKIQALLITLRIAWVNCAKAFVASPLLEEENWASGLTLWSDMMDAVDNTLVLCREAAVRLDTLETYFRSNLPETLERLVAIYLDVYANLASGYEGSIALNVLQCQQIDDELRALSYRCPTFDVNKAFKFQSRAFSGRKFYDVAMNSENDIKWADRSLIKSPNLPNLAVGIARLDMHKEGTHSISLDRERLVWKPDFEEKAFAYTTGSSYISLPLDHDCNGIRFGESMLDLRSSAAVVTPFSAEVKIEKQEDPPNATYSWRIPFSKPFPPDTADIRVLPWIMDSGITWHTSRWGTGCGISLDWKQVTSDEFQIIASVTTVQKTKNLRIGYLAYNGQESCGFESFQWFDRGSTKSFAKYFPFEQNSFTRSPVIAPMLRSFKTWLSDAVRFDVNFAVSKDGMVVKCFPIGDCGYLELGWTLLVLDSSTEATKH